MKRSLAFLATLTLFAGPVVLAQDEEKKEEDLTPQKAMAMLKEVKNLMGKSEELLNDSSRGKALETEADLVQKLRDLLKKSEKSQKDAVDRLAEIIRKAKS